MRNETFATLYYICRKIYYKNFNVFSLLKHVLDFGFSVHSSVCLLRINPVVSAELVGLSGVVFP